MSTVAPWRAARVVAVRRETPHVRTLVLDVADWAGHRAGQHVDVRLTAEDGYQAQRSYSIASVPDGSRVELTVETVDDGEVSPYLTGEMRVGDRCEVRGPIGGYFVWEPRLRSPLALVAGGSGVVPIMAMLRVRAAAGSTVPARLLYSARSYDEIVYRAELDRLAAADPRLAIAYTLTRVQPVGWTGAARRIDRALLAEHVWPAESAPLVYVCGPTAMVEAVAGELVAMGHLPARIRTERFGPSAPRVA